MGKFLHVVCVSLLTLASVGAVATPNDSDDLLLLLPAIQGHHRREALRTAPGEPLGAPASLSIGAAGGSLTSADGKVVLQVPAGALSQNTVLKVTQVVAPAEFALGNYRFEPEGITFKVPVTLTFTASEAGHTVSGLDAFGVAMRKASGKWQWLKTTRNSSAGTLSVQTSHFSEYSSVAGLWLLPTDAKVPVRSSVQMSVGYCGNAESNNDPLAPLTTDPDPLAELVYKCYPFPIGFSPGYANAVWSVNGVAGGNATYGLIQPTPSKSSAAFKAPNQMPLPATVTVSVSNFTYGPTGGKVVYLAAPVTITPPNYEGEFTVQVHDDVQESGSFVDWSVTGHAVWTFNTLNNGLITYHVSGSVTPNPTTYAWQDKMCTLQEPLQLELDSVDSWFLQTSGVGSPSMAWGLVKKDYRNTRDPWLAWDAICCGPAGCSQEPRLLTLLWQTSGGGSNFAPLDASVFSSHLKGTFTYLPTGINDGEHSATASWDFLQK